MAAPCNWDVDPVALGVCPEWNDYPIPARDGALEMATLYLWGATGRRFGVCPVTVRPSQSERGELAYQTHAVVPGSQAGLGQPGGPFLFGGRWFNSGCASACCGNNACAIVLRGPVASVDEVLVGDDVIPPSAYRVDVTNGVYLLVRIDGACWPTCQDFSAEPGEPGAFEVTYGQGVPPPNALLVATAMFACEYAKGLTAGACKLPSKITRLTRQGMEIELEGASGGQQGWGANGGSQQVAVITGIREVDDVIVTLNPNGRQRPPVLLSPDLPEMCDRVTVIGAGS
jgi:hypothetical protein